MSTRTRVRHENAGLGRKYNNSEVLLSEHINLGSYSTVTDAVMSGDGHNFDVTKVSLSGGMISDARSSGIISGRHLVNIQPDVMRQPRGYIYQHLSLPDRPTNAMLAAELLAKTNPSRPVVDMPLLVYELREIPQLLHKEGLSWIQKLAHYNLSYHFGIKPLVNDVIKLISFTDEVAKREKELNQLASRGLRCARDLWAGSNTGPRYETVHSADKFLLHHDGHIATTSKVRGFVEWKVPPNSRLMKGDRRALAKKCVLGMTIDFATAWNAMPWSWLVDWGANIGDILTASRNLTDASHGPVQIMSHTTSTCNFRFPHPEPVSPGSWTLESKQRRSLTHVPISAQLPILSAKQLSILGSIGVTRRMPR